jgi:hypothetical protein
MGSSARRGEEEAMFQKTKWWHLALAWGFVGVPLAWGMIQSVFNAAKLFQ